MAELVSWFNQARKDAQLHPLLLVAIFIVVFLEIHPFQDGNGRLSRVLTTLLLLQSGYAYVPYISLESVIENSKEAYYLALVTPKRRSGERHQNGSCGCSSSCGRSTSRRAGWLPRSSARN